MRQIMDLEHLEDLRECQSLDLIIKKHLDCIDAQNQRVVKMKKNRAVRSQELTENKEKLAVLKADIGELEKKVHTISDHIEKAQSRLPMMTTTQQIEATEKEIATLSPQKEILEDQLLEYMETAEDIEQQVCDADSFLKGSLRSLDEIQIESNDITTKENREIANYQKRIDLLLENIPQQFKDAFLSLNKKYRFCSPVTMVTNGSCAGCYLGISKQQQVEIEKAVTIHFCNGCGRLLLPEKLFRQS